MARMFNYVFCKTMRMKSKKKHGKTKRMNIKKNHDDASSKNTSKTCDNNSVAPWLDLNHDVLLLVMMKLGFVDFLAFNRVCKSWRSLALYNRNKFIVSRPPMSVSIISSEANEKQYYLEDFEGRKIKIVLPHFADTICIGLTNGYLILLETETNDCWLVNLITRHELHFPDSGNVFCCPGYFKAILVFSPSISRWVFIVLNKCYHTLWFSISGKQKWNEVSNPFVNLDLHAFKGKIYTVHCVRRSDEVGLCEMRLYPEPKMVLLNTENFPKPDFVHPGLVSYDENLYVIDRNSKHPYKIHELDFGEMKLVSREKKGEKYAFFRNEFNSCTTFILREVWTDIHSQYGRFVDKDEKENHGLFNAAMWYFFDDCLNVVNLIDG